MSKDKVTDALLEPLKRAIARQGEQPLIRSGKLDGLFPSRSGPNDLAAKRALDDGLLELVREEVKGKTTVQWVRPTPRAVEFVHEHESPLHTLQELRQLLQVNQSNLPQWLNVIQSDIHHLIERISGDTERWSQILNSLEKRVNEALNRLEAARQSVESTTQTPWADDALDYLDHRRETGAAGACPLPELFLALRNKYPDISISTFHSGLRQMQKHRVLSLTGFSGLPDQLAQPEFALLDGAELLYYAVR